MEQLRGIEIFVRAAELGSFAAAATALGLTPSAVSKSVAALENGLRARLLVRAPRGVSLTEEGTRFFNRCQVVLAELAAAQREVSAARKHPKGKLRVALHTGLARSLVLSRLSHLLAQYPDLSLEVIVSPGSRNIRAEGIDVGVFIGEPPELGVIARKIAQLDLVTCASSAYLEKHGTPHTPSDLVNHNCVVYLRPNGKPFDEWHFTRKNDSQTVKVRGNLSVNEGPAMIDAATAGSGIARIFSCQPELTAGSGLLVPILTDWRGAGPPVYVMFLSGGRASAKVRVFVDFVADLFREFNERSPFSQHGAADRWPMHRI